MDWNWFFSALSQSAAAIVGIFGAFIITKILGNQSVFSQKLNACREAIVESQRILDGANDLAIDWYNNMLVKEQVAELERMLEDDYSRKPEQYYDELDFPVFLEKKKALQIIKSLVEKKRAVIEEASIKAIPWQEGYARRFYENLNELPPIAAPVTRLNAAIQPALDKEKREIDSVLKEAKHQTRVNINHLDGIRGNPESSFQITYALTLITILFYVGVILPLTFLPASVDTPFTISFCALWGMFFTLKGLFLVVVALLFTAILIMFFWVNFRLRYPEKIVQSIEEFSRLSFYSHYFSIYEENRFHGSSDRS